MVGTKDFWKKQVAGAAEVLIAALEIEKLVSNGRSGLLITLHQSCFRLKEIKALENSFADLFKS